MWLPGLLGRDVRAGHRTLIRLLYVLPEAERHLPLGLQDHRLIAHCPSGMEKPRGAGGGLNDDTTYGKESGRGSRSRLPPVSRRVRVDPHRAEPVQVFGQFPF
jgi:hypothetical protein